MKRSILIAGGTLSGLGAVMAITPPQLGSSSGSLSLGAGAPAGLNAQPVASNNAATTAAPAATKSAAISKATKSATVKKSTATKSAAATTTQPAATQSASATPATTTQAAAPASSAKDGTFTGSAVDVGYGIVQVEITVQNGKITDARAVSAPTGRSDRWTQMSVPVLRQRTLAAQGSNITAVSGASYTSYGWYKSLVSALAKAGMN